MQKPLILIISHDPLTRNNYKAYFIDELLNDGFNVQYICARNIVGYSQSYKVPNELQHKVFKEVHTRSELLDMLESIEPDKTVVWLDLWYRNQTFYIFRLLNKKGVLYFNIDWWLHTFNSISPVSILSRIPISKPLKTLRKVADTISYRAAVSIADVTGSADKRVVFVPGETKGLRGNTLFKSLNHYNFEEFLTENNDLDPETGAQHIVFIDNYLTSHPDIKRIGQESITAKVYYDKMRSFFNYLEDRYKKKVIIAAHPKAEYKNNEYGDREIWYGKTLALVKSCYFVVQHHSAGINYAIFAGKPILMVYSNEFLNAKNRFLTSTYSIMNNFSKELGSSLINIDLINSDTRIDLEVDDAKYREYARRYLLAENGSKSNYTILRNFFLDYIEEINE